MFGVTVPGGIEEFFATQSAYVASVHGPPDPAELARLALGRESVPGPPISASPAPADWNRRPADTCRSHCPIAARPDRWGNHARQTSLERPAQPCPGARSVQLGPAAVVKVVALVRAPGKWAATLLEDIMSLTAVALAA